MWPSRQSCRPDTRQTAPVVGSGAASCSVCWHTICTIWRRKGLSLFWTSSWFLVLEVQECNFLTRSGSHLEAWKSGLLLRGQRQWQGEIGAGSSLKPSSPSPTTGQHLVYLDLCQRLLWDLNMDNNAYGRPFNLPRCIDSSSNTFFSLLVFSLSL